MRILQVLTLVSPDAAYGGPVTVAVNQTAALREAGHDVTILAGCRGYDEPPTTIGGTPASLWPVRSLVPGTGFSGLASAGLLRWFWSHRHDVDVVHVHLGRDLVTLPVARLAQLAGIPVVLQTHGMVDSSTQPLARLADPVLTSPVLRRAAAVLYLTSTERTELVRFEPRLGPLVHLPNGVPSPQAAAPEHPDREVLFFARLHERKRPVSFVRAAARLVETWPEWRFTLVGPDEGQGALVQQELARAGSSRISWEGPVSRDEAARRMAAAAVMAQPAVDEPFPMSVLEAMSLGVPVVVTTTCGLAEVVGSTGSGAVIGDSVDELVAALEVLIGDPAARRRAAEAAGRTARDRFSMAAVRTQLVEVYADATGSDPGASGDPERLLWLTNFAAPYRRPVWQTLAATSSLRVLLTNDQDAARAVDREEWLDVSASSYQVATASVRSTRLGHVARSRGPHQLSAAVGESDAVLIGGWEEPFYWQALLAAKRRRVATVGFYESTTQSQSHPDGPVAWARRFFFRRLDVVVVPGEAAAQAVREMGVSPSRIHVGFNAVDVEGIHRAADEARAGRAPAAPGHRFVYVGQLIARKNVAALLRAFARVRADGDHLTIVGSGVDEADLRIRADALGLAPYVSWRGPLPYDELPAMLAEEHTLVLPSTEEVWGLVVNEALAAGLGVVVSDRCGVTPSVAGMEGVEVCTIDDDGIAQALAASRERWRGPIQEPAILGYTPQRFAGVFRDAARAASRRHQPGRATGRGSRRRPERGPGSPR